MTVKRKFAEFSFWIWSPMVIENIMKICTVSPLSRLTAHLLPVYTLKYCWRFGRWKNRLSHSATSGLQYFLLPVDYSIFYYQWITVFSATSGLQYFLPQVLIHVSSRLIQTWTYIDYPSATSGLQDFFTQDSLNLNIWLLQVEKYCNPLVAENIVIHWWQKIL
jgi:hypothetical protein